MSLIIATGSNLGDKKNNLHLAKTELSKHFKFIEESNIYSSPAVEYLNQPDFYNQVLEFEVPNDKKPTNVMELLLKIEKELGRNREIPKGPRLIDIDIIFWSTEEINEPNLTVPHPAWSERSFVVYPLEELPYFQTLKNYFKIPKTFNNTATRI